MKNFSNFTKHYVSKNSNLRIFIFGAGTIGRLSDLALKKEGFDAKGFVDSDTRKQGNKIQNKEIISPDELKKFDSKQTHIFIACNYFSSIVPFLKKNNFNNYYIVSDLLKKFDTYKLYNEIDMSLLFAKLLPLKRNV